MKLTLELSIELGLQTIKVEVKIDEEYKKRIIDEIRSDPNYSDYFTGKTK